MTASPPNLRGVRSSYDRDSVLRGADLEIKERVLAVTVPTPRYPPEQPVLGRRGDCFWFRHPDDCGLRPTSRAGDTTLEDLFVGGTA